MPTTAFIFIACLTAADVSAGLPPPESAACGPTALAVSAHLLGRELSVAELRGTIGGRLVGTHSFSQIRTAAVKLGLACRPIKMDARAPKLVRLPLVVPVRQNCTSIAPDHFVVLFGQDGGNVQLIDPPNSARYVPLEEFSRKWNGEGLYFAASEADLDRQLGRPVGWEVWTIIAATAAVVGLGARLSIRRPCRYEKVVIMPCTAAFESFNPEPSATALIDSTAGLADGSGLNEP